MRELWSYPDSKLWKKFERKYEKEKRIILLIPFNPRLPNYGAIVKQHWSYMVKNYPDLKKGDAGVHPEFVIIHLKMLEICLLEQSFLRHLEGKASGRSKGLNGA